ncbi:MAG: hypothetical protein K8F91_02050 [Candidatus Obscuribacterales bacterium]|nr:hypothetical protein [Candidatus Obscuribacterales bacterium]
MIADEDPQNDKLEARICRLEGELQSIQERNLRVEAEKAWEVSWARRASIITITYLAAALVFQLIGSRQSLLDALIPTSAYLLSVLTIPAMKKRWLKKRL